METRKIEVSKVHLDPEQPREIYTGIECLSDSMKAAGFMEDQAISVWNPGNLPEGEYQVIDGHRRTKAAQMAGLLEIPCFVYDGISARDVWEKQLMANANREDLSIMNRARSFKRSIDEHGMNINRVAKIHGVGVSTIKSDLELCGLNVELHKFVDNGKIPKDVARKLATAFENDQQQMHVFNNCVADKKTAGAMLAAIQAYQDKNAQRDIFAQARKEAAANGGLSKARKASEKLEKAVNEFEKFFGDPNVINARKRETGQLRLTALSMRRIADKLLAQIQEHDAMQKINAPKVAVAG